MGGTIIVDTNDRANQIIDLFDTLPVTGVQKANGFHESQMNYSDFIDSFVDKNVADVTIDSNANASSKDIASLISEKGKPHDKLFAFNKIFYEINKKYGLADAREWSKDNVVIVSELTAPYDFKCIWEKPVNRTIKVTDKSIVANEKLFMWKRD